ncbi:trans-acting factor B [uncultured Roseibium sp.]|uniref:trans-acting factor B n=1 Tax=uncultured Roseibium sp. TaxID=1936171 RepID=UPI002627F43B|nr:trans-acting factor B [uncultured Roseibium sp.]
MKKILSYLKRTSRNVFAYLGKLLKKGRSNGQFNLSVAINLPPFVSIRFGYSAPLSSDNDNHKRSKSAKTN